MKSASRRTRRVALLLAVIGAATACAQSNSSQPAALSAETRSVLERVALARARSKLMARLSELPVQEGVCLAAWAGRDAELDRRFRRWVRSLPRSGMPRFYSDGDCEMDVHVTAEELLAALLGLLGDGAAGARADDESLLKRAARTWPEIWCSGAASPADSGGSKKPAGWEDVSIDGIEIVRRAAAADARNALLSDAGRLKVTNARRLAEFIDCSDPVRDALRTGVETIATVRVDFEPDQVGVGHASMKMTDFIRLLTDVHKEHYQGDAFHAADFREMALLTDFAELSAEGLAAPPSRTIVKSPYAPLELSAPPWAEARLTALGRFQFEGAPADEKLTAERARLEGVDELRRQVEALVIQNGVTVAALLAEHGEMKDDVVTFLSSARPIGPPRKREDGAVEVTVELPLHRLWLIVRRAMELVEVDPPASQPTSEPRP
ncbi:hypothetical protein RAS1_02160 [Phycisphaerae bacterium RAS1]|nr:hypothetical protein RAS1_02160 [Phycisphaerae bacterium RAS1]